MPIVHTVEAVGFLILDFDISGMAPQPFVEKARVAFPEVVIVDSSSTDHRDDFAVMGVEHFLQRPWQADDLINTLTGRIGNCLSCGLRIPLRRPTPREPASRWECRGCGGRYLAVFDDDCPHDVLSNVQPADPD